jgi:NADH-quinone oxidoreductase subunit A
MHPYVPVLVLVGLAALFAGGSIVMSSQIGPRRPVAAKSEAYECGIEPTPTPPSRHIPVKYYLTAMLFILFDIEVVFLVPWAVEDGVLGWFGLAEMGVFLATVFVAYAYIWRRGGLEWD